jgi:micrococcal nuclease
MHRFCRIAVSALLLASSLNAGASTFTGTVTHVSDGDSLWVRPAAGGPPREVRLRGIDAPEICQAYGREARAALTGQALHQQVRVAARARDSYQRTLAQVSLAGQDLGAWMVSRGHAWSYRFRQGLGPYARQEALARHARLGLWSGPPPLPPRDFRKRYGSCK